jgi:hypothetical protein
VKSLKNSPYRQWKRNSVKTVLILTLLLLSLRVIIRYDTTNTANLDTNIEHQSISPIGCKEICDVYYFIKDYLIQENQKETPAALEKLIRDEFAALQYEGTEYAYKPYIAEIYETEFAHILRDLCNAKPWCLRIMIYLKNGKAIAAGEQCSCHRFLEENRTAHWQSFFDEQKLVQKETIFPKCKTMFSNICAKLGFLYPTPALFLGTEKLTSREGSKYQQITKAICCNSETNYTYLSSNPNEKDEIIGYIRYVVK